MEMTNAAWVDEVLRRTQINEGLRLLRYFDSRGIPTIGIGYNLQRGPAPLKAVGLTDAEAADVIAGSLSITSAEALALCKTDLAFSVNDARASLGHAIFDQLSDARRYVITDLCYNMGLVEWAQFTGTRAVIDQAQTAKNAGNPNAHSWFVAAGDHLRASAYYTQTGDRAKRNVAMLVMGTWCDANGDGSDILQGAK